MPETNIVQFIDFFDYFKHYIDELSVDQFKKLEDYFTLSQYSIKKTLEVYKALISFLELDERNNYLLTNIMDALSVIQNNLAIIKGRIQIGELKPKKDNINEIKEYFIKIFSKQGNNTESTLIFQNKSGKHTKYLNYVKSKLNDLFITEIHNFRDEKSIDLIIELISKNWKVGIQIEATSDIVELKKKTREITYSKSIKSKITDFKRIQDIDLYIILFCIDLTNKNYERIIRMLLSELKEIVEPRFLFIPPEELVSFFKDLK